MNVTISKGKAQGTIVAPPSKSVAHRMLICGGLANAKSTIKGINNSRTFKQLLTVLRPLEFSIPTRAMCLRSRAVR